MNVAHPQCWSGSISIRVRWFPTLHSDDVVGSSGERSRKCVLPVAADDQRRSGRAIGRSFITSDVVQPRGRHRHRVQAPAGPWRTCSRTGTGRTAGSADAGLALVVSQGRCLRGLASPVAGAVGGAVGDLAPPAAGEGRLRHEPPPARSWRRAPRPIPLPSGKRARRPASGG